MVPRAGNSELPPTSRKRRLLDAELHYLSSDCPAADYYHHPIGDVLLAACRFYCARAAWRERAGIISPNKARRIRIPNVRQSNNRRWQRGKAKIRRSGRELDHDASNRACVQ